MSSDKQEVVGEAVPAAQRSSWSSFLKSIASVSGDLSSLTAPPFILSPVSLTEFPAYWCEHPAVFAAIADAKDNQTRAVAVLKWFVTTLKGQYTSRNESMGSEKKPLNPVLGELFYGHWPSTGKDASSIGETTLLVEQVSHHPPITAYVIENKSKGLRLRGHNAQKTSFSAGSIIVKQIGHAILTVNLPNDKKEDYLITLPRLRIDGLWYGSPYIELSETSHIIGGGYISTIEYKGKGYFSGKSHSFKATLVPAPGHGSGNHDETVVEGTWHTTSKVVKGKNAVSTSTSHWGGSSSHAGAGDHFHDVSDATGTHKTEVAALGGATLDKASDGQSAGDDRGMGPFETRRLWKEVASGIREGDFDKASREKSRIENEQRQMRKDEAAAGTSWQLRHFKKIDSDPIYERLGKLVKLAPPTEDTYEFLENWPAVPGVTA